MGQAMQVFSVPCCGSVGGCGARAVSRKTPIYFILLDIAIISLFDAQWNSLQYGVQHTRTLGAVDDDVGRRR